LKTLRIAGLKRINGKSFIVYRKGRPLSHNALDYSRCWVDRGKSSVGTEHWKKQAEVPRV
jgi:hypothetical protein